MYPSIYDSGFNASARDILFNNIHPGLCYLSAVCKKEGFDDISLVDLRTLKGWDEFRARIAELSPDVAGITMMSPDYPYAMQAIDILKEVCPGARLVVGGYHPTIMPEEVSSNGKIDHIIVGEAESALPELLKAIRDNKPATRLIKGTISDVEKLPFMDRELFDCLELPYDFFLKLPFFTILAGRGCTYNCKFCSPAGKLVHGYKIRRRSVDNVIRELEYLRDTYGFRSLQFWDDCFTEDVRWVMEFCDKYKKKGFRQSFVCQTRADIICKNPVMMRELKKAGLVMASIGFESGNDRVLKFINKGTTLKQNIEAAGICRRFGIKIWAYHMYGVPTETNEEAMDTVRMIKRIKPYRSSAAFYTPHPGSHFYEYCSKNDLALIDKHDSFARFPEIDKPKIKNIDYDAIRQMARISKNVAPSVKLRIRLERLFVHKINKSFKVRFEEELKKDPRMNKTAVLRLAHAMGRI